MNDWQIKVREFHKAFDHPHSDKVVDKQKDGELMKLRLRCMLEECFEYAKAAGINIYVAVPGITAPVENIHYIDLVHIPNAHNANLPDRMDALVDLGYFLFGSAVAEGVDLDPLMEEVHKANMAKLNSKGKPIKRRDGKIKKPRGWKPPDIEGKIKEQIDG